MYNYILKGLDAKVIDELNQKLISLDNVKAVIKDMAKEQGKALLEELSRISGEVGAVATTIKNLISIVPKFEAARKINNTNLDSFKSYQASINFVNQNN